MWRTFYGLTNTIQNIGIFKLKKYQYYPSCQGLWNLIVTGWPPVWPKKQDSIIPLWSTFLYYSNGLALWNGHHKKVSEIYHQRAHLRQMTGSMSCSTIFTIARSSSCKLKFLQIYFFDFTQAHFYCTCDLSISKL